MYGKLSNQELLQKIGEDLFDNGPQIKVPRYIYQMLVLYFVNENRSEAFAKEIKEALKHKEATRIRREQYKQKNNFV